MPITIKFGDIFNYREKDYVFLVKTDDLIYAAQILDLDLSTQIQRKHSQVLRNGKEAIEARHNVLYCYVVLKTEEFKKRIAHFADATHDETSLIIGPVIGVLDKCDLEEIRNEILDDYSPVSRDLKELIKKIEIKKER